MNPATILSTLLFCSAGFYYCYLILTDPSIQPAFTTWFIFFIAVSVSFSSYLLKRRTLKKWWVNIQNATDVFFVGLTLILIVWKNGWEIFPISSYEKICVALAGVIIFFWLMRRDHLRTNIMTQSLLIIGYYPTLEKLWLTGNHESYFLWAFYWLGSLVTLIPAIEDKDWLAVLYSTRAFIMISVVLIFMTIA